MDLRNFYQRLRDAETAIKGDHVVIVSDTTPDGGKAGVFTEVSRANAARMIVELRARLATSEEAAAFRTKQEENARVAEAGLFDGRMPIAVVSEPEIRKLRDKIRPPKG